MNTDWLFWAGGTIIALAGVTLAVWALFADRSRGRRRCPKCWYDLSKTPGLGLRCSECGHEVKRESKLFKTRRRWKFAFVSIAVLLLAAYVALQPKVRKDGWASVTPTTALLFVLQFSNSDWVLDGLSQRTNLSEWQQQSVRDTCLNRYDPNGPLSNATRRQLIDLFHIWDTVLEVRAHEPSKAPALALKAKYDPDPAIRARVVDFLALSRDPESAWPVMLQFLEDPDPQVRLWTILAMRFVAEKSDAATTKLLELFKSDDSQVRAYAIRSLGKAAKKRSDKKALIQKVVEMSNDDPQIQQAVLKALTDADVSDDEILPLIRQALKSSDPDVIVTAFQAVYLYRDLHPTFVQDALEAVSSESSDVAEEASFLIERMKPELFASLADQLAMMRDSQNERASEVARKKLFELKELKESTGD